MDKNMTITLVLAIIIIAGLALLYYTQLKQTITQTIVPDTFPITTTTLISTTTSLFYFGEYSDCVKNKLNYTPTGGYNGEVIVRFKGDVTFENAVSFLEINNITIINANRTDYLNNFHSITLQTVAGKEFYLMCKLEREDLVKMTYIPLKIDIGIPTPVSDKNE